MPSSVSHDGPDERSPVIPATGEDREGRFDQPSREEAVEADPAEGVEVDAQALLAGLVEPPPAGGPDLSGVPLDELLAELNRRQRSASRLLREKERLRARLVEIDRELAGLAPSAPPNPGPAPVAVGYRKPISDLTVAEAMARIFELGEEFSPSDAAERLLDAGFQSRASNFRQIVSQTLTRELRFKRVARGVYLRTS